MMPRMITPFHCDVYYIYVNGIPYYGLAITECADDITFSWLMDKRRLHDVQKVKVMYGMQWLITNAPVQSIRYKRVLRTELNNWVFSRNPEAFTSCAPEELGEIVLNFTTVERNSDMDFIIHNNSSNPMSVEMETGCIHCDIQV